MTSPELSHQINLALRTAAGHARAARDVEVQADRTYEMKMKSAGASVYEAWKLAVKAQPEYQGRKIDDAALRRIYESTKARPWWDRYLAAVKVEGKPATRDWAKRTMQWHLDPDAARARRGQAMVRSAAHHKRVKAAAAARPSSWGGRTPQAGPTTSTMREVVYTAGDPHQVPIPEDKQDREEAIRLLERARRAVLRLSSPLQLAEAEALVRLTVEGLEAL